MFYRDWLLDAPYTREERWATYCSEHKLMVVNTAINLPHNPRAFAELFGNEKVWQAFKEKFERATGRAFAEADETDFVPLWKREGLRLQQVQPPSKEQWDAFDRARSAGELWRALSPQERAPFNEESSVSKVRFLARLIAHKLKGLLKNVYTGGNIL